MNVTATGSGDDLIAEPQVRETLTELARAARVLGHEGHEDQFAGHVSMRDPRGRGVWLKRGTIGLCEVTGEDFNLIDFDGNVLGGKGPRHAEWPIHTKLLAARPDLNFVAHSHPQYVVLMSCLDEDLGQYLTEIFFRRPVRYPDSARIRRPEQGTALAKCMGQANVAIMRNHGCTFAGRSIAELCVVGIRLEWSCKTHVMLSQSHSRKTFLDMAEADKTPVLTLEDYERYYQYYCRKLERDGCR